MTPGTWQWWLGASLAWAVVLVALLYAGAQWHHWKTERCRAARALHFEHWARRTMITITMNDGIVYADTLHRLYLPFGARLDEAWRDVYAVNLWTVITPESAHSLAHAISCEASDVHQEHTGE